MRAGKANANVMPKIRATGVNLGAIRAESGAHGYRLIGLDIGVDDSVAQLANLVELGSGQRHHASRPSRPTSSSIAATCTATTRATTAAASR